MESELDLGSDSKVHAFHYKPSVSCGRTALYWILYWPLSPLMGKGLFYQWAHTWLVLTK